MEMTINRSNDTLIIDQVKRWLDQFIIELNLCPFAKRERINNRIKFVVSTSDHHDPLLADLAIELEYLNSHPDTETTLLIHPHVLTGFADYNQFLNQVDALIDALDLIGVYQVASFHPGYQFADTGPDDPENYTNRSPYPILHILREASVAEAIDSHPDADSIPITNINKLNELGVEKLRTLQAIIFRGG